MPSPTFLGATALPLEANVDKGALNESTDVPILQTKGGRRLMVFDGGWKVGSVARD